jgi:phasin
MTDVIANSKTGRPKVIPSTEAPSIDGNGSVPDGSYPEFPLLFRGFTEKSTEQAKENWLKMKSATEKLTRAAQDSCSATAKESLDYLNQVMVIAASNAHAAFDLANALVQARTPSEIIEVSAAHARKRMDQIAEQNRKLWSAAQKIQTSITKPLKLSDGV